MNKGPLAFVLRKKKKRLKEKGRKISRALLRGELHKKRNEKPGGVGGGTTSCGDVRITGKISS